MTDAAASLDEVVSHVPDAAAPTGSTHPDATPDGGAVLLPAALSPSRAGDFQTCPLLFRFRSIDRLPEPPSEAAVRGTLVHGALDAMFDLEPTARTPDDVRSLLPGVWDAMLADDPDSASVIKDRTQAEWLATADPFIEAYFSLENPTRLEPAGREQLVEAPLAMDPSDPDAPALVARGYVDRLDVSPDGALRIVDYKTGRAPGEAFERKALFQMRFYALALWRSQGIVAKQLKLLYLSDRQALTDHPDVAALEATERKVHALWRAIRMSVERRSFAPNPSRLCDWCAHKALCPAYDGTPPELPVLTIVPHRSQLDPLPDTATLESP